jgi:hypothetical protein
MVSNAENIEQEAPFLQQEIREVVFDIYSDGAPGPDGLSFIFYQKFGILLRMI